MFGVGTTSILSPTAEGIHDRSRKSNKHRVRQTGTQILSSSGSPSPIFPGVLLSTPWMTCVCTVEAHGNAVRDSAVNAFPRPYDFLDIFFSLDYFIVRTQHSIHIACKIRNHPLCQRRGFWSTGGYQQLSSGGGKSDTWIFDCTWGSAPLTPE